MEVQSIWFDLLVSGVKHIEGRKKTPKWEKLTVGQIIEVTCKETQETRLFKITHINEYDNLIDYLIIEGLHRCLPGVNSMEKAVAIYHQYSTPKELDQYKFLAIGMHVI
jgi:ASC-1-like (ASCH) protein